MTNIRAKLDYQLRESPTTESEWDCLVAEGHVGEVEAGAWEVDDLEAKLTQLRRIFSGPRHISGQPEEIEAPPPKDQSVIQRIDALSTVFAAWAAEDSAVKGFRSRHLVDWGDPTTRSWLESGGHGAHPGFILLKVGQVPAWITQAHHARSPTGDGDDHVTGLVRRRGRTELLEYIADQQARRLTVDANGPLGELAKLSGRLAHRFRWHPAEATVFVLTGEEPEVLILAASTEIRTDVATRLDH